MKKILKTGCFVYSMTHKTVLEKEKMDIRKRKFLNQHKKNNHIVVNTAILDNLQLVCIFLQKSISYPM